MRKIKLRRTRVLISAGALIVLAVAFAQSSAKDSYLNKLVSSSDILGSIFRSAGSIVSAESSPQENVLLAVETWSGQAGDNNWSSNLNWEGIGGAGADDDLVFPLEPLGGLPSHNDFTSGTQFRSISIQNNLYNITGNQIRLTAGLSSSASNGIASDVPDFSPGIILEANQTFSTGSKDLNLNGVINLNGQTLNVTSGAQSDVNFNGSIAGAGLLNLAGNATIFGNAFANGSTEVDSGRLSVNTPSVIGSVNLNGGAVQGTGTIGAITANAVNGGDIRPGLNNGTQAGNTGVLTTTNGASILNAATTLEIHMFGTIAGTQLDQLRANGSNINLGGANLDLIVGFTPTVGHQFNIVSQQGTGDLTGQFAQGSIINSSGHIFAIAYTVNGVVLTYQGNTLVWDGSSGSSWGTAANWDANIAPSNLSAGTDLVFPSGAQNLNNSNNVGGLTLGSIQFTGAGYQVFGNAISLTEGISDTSNGNNTFDPDLTFTANQTFSKTGSDNFTMFGDLNLGLFRLTVDGAGTISIPSNIVGTNSGGAHIAVEKNGSGTLGLSGSGNNYLGQTRVNAGTLTIGSNSALGATQNTDIDRTVIASGATLRIGTAGYQSNEKFELNGAGFSNQGAIFSTSCVTCILNGDISFLSNTTINLADVGNSLSLNGNIFGGSTLTKTGAGTLVFNAGATNFAGTTLVSGGKIIVNGNNANNLVSLNGGTVAGNGTIGSLSGTGTVAPGTSAGILTVSGNATFGAGTNLNIELNGTTVGTQYDRLVVTGTTNLGGANLVGSLGFTPTNGQQFTIIQSAGAITGQFAQGNSINIGGTNFGITYNANSIVLTVGTAAANAPFDYDADGKTDVSVFRPSNGTWFVGLSGNSTMYVQPWGLNGDTIVPADYDGDGKTDLAVRRPSDDNFYIFNSSNSTVEVRNFGIAGDIAIPSDYNGDGKADVAVWRPSNGTWFLSLSGSGIFYVMPWGLSTDKPVPGDFDGDGKTELAVFRPSEGKWYTFSTVTGTISVTEWGVNGDLPVQGDYNGDGRTDFAVYRPSNNTWFRQNSNDGAVSSTQWGLPGDFVVPGDYDGDGKIDVAVWRPSDATWYVNRSSSGIFTQTFGVSGDKPIPSAFVF